MARRDGERALMINNASQDPGATTSSHHIVAMQAANLPFIAAAKRTARNAATSSRRRKSGSSSLEEDIAAYKQNLDHISTDGMGINLTCNQVRSRINKLLDNGIMKKGEFCKAIGSSNNAMPDVKKRQKTEAAAAATGGGTAVSAPPSTASGPKKAVAAPVTPGLSPTDISSITLPGEESDSVLAQFCRDLYAQLHRPTCKSFQSKMLNDFRGKKGPLAGCTSSIFYATYVYFEKKRIAEGKPKSQHRIKMEEIWAKHGGFERESDGRNGYWLRPGETIHISKYGELSIN
ncbi:hypothetical protein F5X99DRAFT_432734 [Biscogniauxia marginata]|nr:hypothetical protein F5X99DRAFT_432734 [Biscogniauxia marginata]